MAYFVTGGTGFIGRHFVARIAPHGEPIYVLVRAGARKRFERLMSDNAPYASLLHAVEGDVTADRLGIPALERERLRGRIQHFVHLAALYDLAADADALEQANVQGTRHALELAQDLECGCFHLVSSIAVAGKYPGVFTEAMFEEAERLEHPYFRTKHDAEALVRETSRIAWRIYRPGMVVGDSTSGAMDKIDGPYYLFKLIQKLRDGLPPWVPLVGFEGGHINLVPVDFVAAALAHLVSLPGIDRRCFHLTDPKDRRMGEVLNLFAKVAHAPVMTTRLDSSLMDLIPWTSGQEGRRAQPLGRMLNRVLRELGIPRSVLGLLDLPTRFDCAEAQSLLAKADISVPRLEDYAWRLWDYWERQLDPDLPTTGHLRAAVQGKTVLITGGSSGIGRATAVKLADAGAHVLIVGRDPERLERTRREIEARGGRINEYVCDIADASACERFLTQLLAEHGYIDILVNNAGHSIRRSIEHTYERFHDYERLIGVNYFGAVRVTLGLLPAMIAHGSGHVICISSIGVLTNAPHFAAYNASKAALEAFARCAAAEYADRNVRFSVINMPLVRTPMVAPTRIYDQLHLLEPEQAADLVCTAIIQRPARLTSRLGMFAQLVEAFTPWIGTAVMGENFRMFPQSEAAPGSQSAGSRETASSSRNPPEESPPLTQITQTGA
ncbi:MAG TPA: SDR family oxidoreductase [Steroidobacteraceae bacterium]|nr:SDR family oxidoreductase [Steroidobacteraceae bacterium]